MRIRFQFDSEKLVAVLAFFASKGIGDLDAMKSAKLLFFADKRHLLKYGRPILGDEYYCMPHGPVPTRSLNMIQDAFSPNPSGDSEHMDEYLGVDRNKRYPSFTPKKAPDLDVLSTSDLEILEEIASEYGAKDAWQLRELSHLDPTVKLADEQRLASSKGSVPIPFNLFFDPVADKAMLSAVADAQGDRDFAESLNW